MFIEVHDSIQLIELISSLEDAFECVIEFIS